jgi:hypothetical protein
MEWLDEAVREIWNTYTHFLPELVDYCSRRGKILWTCVIL